MASTQQVIVKAYYNDLADSQPEIRRFTIDVSSANDVYRALETTIAQLNDNYRPGQFALQYVDEDNDRITFSSDSEFRSALHNIPVGGTIKIYVKPKVEKSEPTSENPTVHSGVTCDGCQGSIIGIRYKCAECPDYDLCQTCSDKNLHAEHNMIKIIRPAQRPFGGHRRCGRGQVGDGPFGGGRCGRGQVGDGPFGGGRCGRGQVGDGLFGGGRCGRGQVGDGLFGGGRCGRGQVGDGLFGGGRCGRGKFGGGPFGGGRCGAGGPRFWRHFMQQQQQEGGAAGFQMPSDMANYLSQFKGKELAELVEAHLPEYLRTEKVTEMLNQFKTGEQAEKPVDQSILLENVGKFLREILSPFGIDCDYFVDSQQTTKPTEQPETKEKTEEESSTASSNTSTEPKPTAPPTTAGASAAASAPQFGSLLEQLQTMFQPIFQSAATTTAPAATSAEDQQAAEQKKFEECIERMTAMGFVDSNGVLSELIKSKKGDLNQVLDALNPRNYKN